MRSRINCIIQEYTVHKTSTTNMIRRISTSVRVNQRFFHYNMPVLANTNSLKRDANNLWNAKDATEAKEAVKDAWSDAKEIAKDATTEGKIGAKDAWQDTKNMAEKTWDAAKETAENAASQAYSNGPQILRETKQAVKETIKGVSPSQEEVMRKGNEKLNYAKEKAGEVYEEASKEASAIGGKVSQAWEAMGKEEGIMNKAKAGYETLTK